MTVCDVLEEVGDLLDVNSSRSWESPRTPMKMQEYTEMFERKTKTKAYEGVYRGLG